MKWKKASIIVIDIVLAVYLIFAITAFNKPDEETLLCTEVPISIEEGITEGFLNEKEIARILKKAKLYPVGRNMQEVNIRQIEEVLQAHELIENAEVYKTPSGHVCIDITQRIPIVRVMAANGDDYCIDSDGSVMPHTNYACDLLVVTGHVSKPYAQKTLSAVATIINNNQFWKNQTVQLNVLSDGSLELVPRVGEHIAYLGQPTDIEMKLERLRKFYQYGLSQAGWNQYSRINVEFSNQIICKKRKHRK